MTDFDGEGELEGRDKKRWERLAETPFDELEDGDITSMIKLSIKRRFSFGEWILCFEFTAPNGRRCDAIAINTLPSRNHKIVGFEFKASRSDWLAELREGEKADYFVQLCDEWYVVAGGTDVVKESEVPEGWGYLEMKPNSKQIYKQRESALTEHQQGEPDRWFWTKFLKKTVGSDSNFTKQDIDEAKRRGYEKAQDDLSQRQIDRDAEKMRDKAKTVDKLREAGLFGYVHPVDDEKIARINRAGVLLKEIEGDNFGSIENHIEHLEDRSTSALEQVKETAEQMQEVLDDLRESTAEVTEDG